jgi:hypothetical protein
MKWHFNLDPTRDDYDQVPLTPLEEAAIYKACIVIGIILIIGYAITIYLICS